MQIGKLRDSDFFWKFEVEIKLKIYCDIKPTLLILILHWILKTKISWYWKLLEIQMRFQNIFGSNVMREARKNLKANMFTSLLSW
jgi:hypothetical protein